MASHVTAAPLQVSKKFKGITHAMMTLGVLTFFFTLFKDKERAWYSYLLGYYYFVTIGIGGLFFVAILSVTNAGWSANIRRFPEALAAYMPYALVGGVIFLFGAHNIYEWLNPAAVAHDANLQHKAPYLNMTFFAIRTIAFLVIWFWYGRKLLGMSTEQDKTGDAKLTLKAVPLAISFLLIYAISFSLFSVDLLMSLQPHWFSTIFGVYCFAGMFQSALAMMILFVIYGMKRGLLKGLVDENHLHDLGKFLFAFTVFWAYIAYSQYMLIWYANLPEETQFFIPRSVGSWGWVSVSLIMFRFIVPFLYMCSRKVKRNPDALKWAAMLILVMQFVDIYWLIYPNFNMKEAIFGFPELLVWVGFAGAFLHASVGFLSKNPIVPLRDPRQQESLHHHVVY